MVYNLHRPDGINSSLKRRRFCFYFLLLHHPSQSGSVLQNFHSWATGSFLSQTLPLWGHHCSLCTHPCLRAIWIRLYPRYWG